MTNEKAIIANARAMTNEIERLNNKIDKLQADNDRLIRLINRCSEDKMVIKDLINRDLIHYDGQLFLQGETILKIKNRVQ